MKVWAAWGWTYECGAYNQSGEPFLIGLFDAEDKANRAIIGEPDGVVEELEVQ